MAATSDVPPAVTAQPATMEHEQPMPAGANHALPEDAAQHMTSHDHGGGGGGGGLTEVRLPKCCFVDGAHRVTQHTVTP